MKADSSGQVGAEAKTESEKFGHFLDPFSPIPTARAAKGRIRLAAIVSYFAWVATLITMIALFGQMSQAEGGAPVSSGARALIPILIALLIVLPIGATISLFAQNMLSTGLLAVSLVFWLAVRVYLHVNMVTPAGVGIVLIAASVMFTVLVAIALTHAVRSQLALRQMARAD